MQMGELGDEVTSLSDCQLLFGVVYFPQCRAAHNTPNDIKRSQRKSSIRSVGSKRAQGITVVHLVSADLGLQRRRAEGESRDPTPTPVEYPEARAVRAESFWDPVLCVFPASQPCYVAVRTVPGLVPHHLCSLASPGQSSAFSGMVGVGSQIPVSSVPAVPPAPPGDHPGAAGGSAETSCPAARGRSPAVLDRACHYVAGPRSPAPRLLRRSCCLGTFS